MAKAHDLISALRFHKHELTQQAADRIEALEEALHKIADPMKTDKPSRVIARRALGLPDYQ